MKKKIVEISVAVAWTCGVFGCGNRDIELRAKLDDLDVVCNVDRIQKPEAQLHGQVKLINNGPAGGIYNLKRIALAVKDDTSSIYIDRFVDFIITDKGLKSHDSISYSVYWPFDRSIQPDEVNSLSLHINPNDRYIRPIRQQ